MGSSKGPVTLGLGLEYVPCPGPSIRFQDLPSLVHLLEKTFEIEKEKQEDDGSSANKRPKVVSVPDIPVSPPPGVPGVPAAPPAKDLEDQPRLPVVRDIMGIPTAEFRSYPSILLALRRLLSVLNDVFVRRHHQSSVEMEDLKEDLEVLEKETEKLNKAMAEIEQLSLYTWEQLNTGHWKSVPGIWRKMYTLLKILKVSFMVIKVHPSKEIIKECDMGLLMGEPISGNVLRKIAEELSAKIYEAHMEEEARQRRKANSTLVQIKTELEQDSEDVNNGSSAYTTAAESESPPTTAPLKNKSENASEIFYTHQPSLQEFLCTYMQGCTPGVLLNIVDHWPAMGKWSVDYINKVAGFRTVPVEVGQKYTSADWTQKIMTISEFIEKYMKKTGRSSSSRKIGYIAQYTLFDQLPVLAKDIRIPDLCHLTLQEEKNGDEEESPEKRVEVNAWFGPANTISPCHYDPKHNILVQVFGSKAIRLFPPGESEHLRPHPKSSLLFNTSQLDVEQDDLFDKYPEMKTVQHYDVILKEGQALYIPPRWWHYVKSLSPSFSVSFWFP